MLVVPQNAPDSKKGKSLCVGSRWRARPLHGIGLGSKPGGHRLPHLAPIWILHEALTLPWAGTGSKIHSGPWPMSRDVPPTAGLCSPAHSPQPLLQTLTDPKEMPGPAPYEHPLRSPPDWILRPKCLPSSKTQRTMPAKTCILVSLTPAQRASSWSFPRVLYPNQDNHCSSGISYMRIILDIFPLFNFTFNGPSVSVHSPSRTVLIYSLL